MNAEELRSIYNRHFSSASTQWSSTDMNKTLRVATKAIEWARKSGLDSQEVSVLDVGCATGYYSEAFRLLGCRVTGLDYSEVAIERASASFPDCAFVQMDGFNPAFSQKFDLIFCRGFSGANTHDLDFIAGWVNRYLEFLSPTGVFILSYSTNFAGKEKEGETVNLTHKELNQLAKRINGRYRGIFYFYYFGFISKVKRRLEMAMKRNTKEYYSMIFSRS